MIIKGRQSYINLGKYPKSIDFGYFKNVFIILF